MSSQPNNIRALREKLGLSQEQLAERVRPATTKMQISRLEKSQRRLTHDWMVRLASALECHPSDLAADLTPATDPKEAELLKMFRGLSEKDQARFLAVAEALVKDQEEEGDNGA